MKYFRAFLEIGVFSFFTNILALVIPLYMLQIYDRVLPSGNGDTLIFISIIVVIALLLSSLLESVRSIYAARIGARLVADTGPKLIRMGLRPDHPEHILIGSMKALETTKGFLQSPVLFGIFDLPFTPIFLFVLFLIHPLICAFVSIAIIILIIFAIIGFIASRKPSDEAMAHNAEATRLMSAVVQEKSTYRAMGLEAPIINRWGNQIADNLALSDKVNNRTNMIGGVSRFIRQIVQAGLLGVGAYLVLNENLSAGMIFAASLIGGRALQPIDRLVAGWRQIIIARKSWKDLQAALRLEKTIPENMEDRTSLTGAFKVRGLSYLPLNARRGDKPLLSNINFDLAAGQTLAITGAPASGKTVLAELLAGIRSPYIGSIILDNIELNNWNQEALNGQIGYLAQSPALLPGTIAENISHFDPDAKIDMVAEAAKKAGVHAIIANMKDGFDTVISNDRRMAASEMQAIGLARALYTAPKLVILDSPDAYRRQEELAALAHCLKTLREEGTSIIMVAPHGPVLRFADYVLILDKGHMQDYGPRDEVSKRLNERYEAKNRPKAP